MAASIDSSPDLIRPINQPLIFTLSYMGVSPLVRYIVQVEEDGTEIAKLYLTPNTVDKVHFDLSEVARDRVSCDDKNRAETDVIHAPHSLPYTTGRNGLKKYEVKVGSFDGTTETLNEDSESVYLLDGAEQIVSGLHPSFDDYYSTDILKKVWLTDRVREGGNIVLKASEDDEGVIAFLNDSTIIGGQAVFMFYYLYNGTTLLQNAIYLIDSSNGAQLPSAADINQKLTYLGVYPKNLESYLDSADRPSNNPTWTRYEFHLWSATAQTAIKLIVNKDCSPIKHDPVQLAWTNTRGGWDYLKFDGRSTKTIKQESKMYKKRIGDWDASTYTFLPSARESQPYQVTGVQSYELKSANMSDSELELLQYALRSDNVMMRIGSAGKWLPVNIDSKSYKVDSGISKIREVSFNVTQAQAIKC